MRIPAVVFLSLLISLFAYAQTSYFPPSSFDAKPRVDHMMAEYVSHEAELMAEPSLWTLSRAGSSETYRFLWLRSFHAPVSVRLDVQTDNTGVLTVRVAPGSAGFPYTSKGPFRSTTAAVSAAQIASLRALIRNSGFWAIPPHVANDQQGTDGSTWVIEAVHGKQYHLVQRWLPAGSTGPGKKAVAEIGEMLALNLAHLSIAKDELY